MPVSRAQTLIALHKGRVFLHFVNMNIAILTGAGISAESGIRTFRDTGGLWETHSIHEVATPEGFTANPALVHKFYNARRAALSDVAPNPAHIALGRLQRELNKNGGSLTLVTQNVDDLHECGGAIDVIHMHGTLLQMLCGACSARWTWTQDAPLSITCPSCSATLPGVYPLAVPRPDIVWFGEMPFQMDRIEAAVSTCDLFVSIGTSGEVYPAAGYVSLAKAHGRRTMEINLEPSSNASLFDQQRIGKAGALVPVWVDEILSHI